MLKNIYTDAYSLIKSIVLKNDLSSGLKYFAPVGDIASAWEKVNPVIELISHHPALMTFRLKHLEDDKVEYHIGRRAKQSTLMEFLTDYAEPMLGSQLMSSINKSFEESLRWDIYPNNIIVKRVGSLEDLEFLLPSEDSEVKLIESFDEAQASVTRTTLRKALARYLANMTDLYHIEIVGIGRLVALTNLFDYPVMGYRYFIPIYSEGDIFGLFYGIFEVLLYDELVENRVYHTSFSLHPSAIIVDDSIGPFDPIEIITKPTSEEKICRYDYKEAVSSYFVIGDEGEFYLLMAPSKKDKDHAFTELIENLDQNTSSKKAFIENKTVVKLLISEASVEVLGRNRFFTEFRTIVSVEEAYVLRGMRYEKRHHCS